MRALIVLHLMISLFSCSVLPEPPKRGVSYYALESNPCNSTAPAIPASPLPITVDYGNPLYNSTRILFRRAPNEWGFYQFAQWIQPPRDQVAMAVKRGIECEGVSGMDHSLRLSLEEMYHDAASRPGEVHLVLTARLSRPDGTTEAARFSETIPLDEFNAEGAARAFNAALLNVIKQMTVWLKGNLR